MPELLPLIPASPEDYFFPFAELKTLPEVKATELNGTQPIPIIEAPLDLSALSDFHGVQGKILLSAVPQQLRDIIRIWSEPLGTTSRDKAKGLATLMLGTQFHIDTIDQFMRIFRYGVEIDFKSEPSTEVVYLHCGGRILSTQRAQQMLYERPYGLTLTHYQMSRNTAGNIEVDEVPSLLPQELAVIGRIGGRITQPPFEYRTAEDILRNTRSPRNNLR